MKKVVLFLSLCLSVHLASAQNNALTAISFVNHLVKGEYGDAVHLFDQSITSLNGDVLKTGWQQIQAAYGNYQSYYVPAIKDSNANSIILGVQFEKALHGFACGFNEKQQLISFTLAAAPAKNEGNTAQKASLYNNKEVSIPVAGGALKGSIMLPISGKAEKYVLIIAGSGPTDRDGNSPLGVSSNSYKLLAEQLAKEGIASLRYDKRMIAASNGFSQTESEVRFEDYVNDAAAAITFLTQTEHAEKVYIAGHSEGSLLGILAAQKKPVNGYISICGAGENIANILKRQLNKPEANPILEKLKKGESATDLPSDLQAIFRPQVQPFLISWMKYDPVAEISKLKIPVLIIGGTTDIQVPAADAERLHKGLPKSQLLIVTGMNHVLKDAPADPQQNMASYSNADLPLNTQMATQIVSFIKKN